MFPASDPTYEGHSLIALCGQKCGIFARNLAHTTHQHNRSLLGKDWSLLNKLCQDLVEDIDRARNMPNGIGKIAPNIDDHWWVFWQESMQFCGGDMLRLGQTFR